MNVLHIAIDIDNVISESALPILNRFNEHFQTRVTYEETKSFWLTRSNTGIEDIYIQKFFEELLINEEFQLNLPPYKKALEVIKKWQKKGFHIHYITARPKNTGEITRKWLLKHGFTNKNSTLHNFDPEKYTSDTEYKKKTSEKLKADIFIEDSLEIVRALDIPVLLIDQPWNQGKLKDNIKRVYGWDKIEDFLESFDI